MRDCSPHRTLRAGAEVAFLAAFPDSDESGRRVEVGRRWVKAFACIRVLPSAGDLVRSVKVVPASRRAGGVFFAAGSAAESRVRRAGGLVEVEVARRSWSSCSVETLDSA